MYPPLFKAAQASPEVLSIFGSSPLRIYPFGEAEGPPALPYAAWQVISGNPENFLSGRPDVDGYRTQIDVYADTVSNANRAAEALRDAFERVAYIVSFNGNSRDPETKNYRISFDVEWLVRR